MACAARTRAIELDRQSDQGPDAYRLAQEAWEQLKPLPAYAAGAEELLARFFERRAIRSAYEERRDEAILWWLKALKVKPSCQEYRRAANLLIDTDYTRLMKTTRIEVRSRESPAVIDFSNLGPMAFSPDGRLATTGEGVVQLWDLRNLDDPPNVTLPCPEGSTITAVALNPDGRLVMGGSEGTARSGT